MSVSPVPNKPYVSVDVKHHVYLLYVRFALSQSLSLYLCPSLALSTIYRFENVACVHSIPRQDRLKPMINLLAESRRATKS